jgi:hypothetical protein
MDFSKAVKTNNRKRRERAIEAELYEADWGDYLEDYLQNGGWVDDVQITDIEFEEGDSECVKVRFNLDFVEAAATSCQAIDRCYRGYTRVTVSIDRETGDFDVDCQNVAVDDDATIRSGDYY